MDEITIIVAVIGACASVAAAVVASRVTVRSQVARVQKDNQLLYLWNRELVDHIYKKLGPPPPAPPDHLFE